MSSLLAAAATSAAMSTEKVSACSISALPVVHPDDRGDPQVPDRHCVRHPPDATRHRPGTPGLVTPVLSDTSRRHDGRPDGHARGGRGAPACARGRARAAARRPVDGDRSQLVAGQRRVLVVQRTGWGKSAVYFVATALLRARGAGPTVIVSPLLALMRNQVEAAVRAGIHARTVDWANLGSGSRSTRRSVPARWMSCSSALSG